MIKTVDVEERIDIKIDKIEPKQVTKLETNATTLVVSISYRRIIPTLKNNSKPNIPTTKKIKNQKILGFIFFL